MTQPSSTTVDPVRSVLSESLVAEAVRAGLDAEVFDDMVHDLVHEGSLSTLNATDDEDAQEAVLQTSEQRASAINNGGLSAQIPFILGHYKDPAVGAEVIRALIRDNT